METGGGVLFDLALRLGLTRYIRVREGTETSPHHKGKTVSDVVKARDQAGWHLLRRLGVVLSEEEEKKNREKKDKATCATSNGDGTATNAPPQQSSSSVPHHHWMFMEQQEEEESKHPWMEQVEAVLGYQFKNPHLLLGVGQNRVVHDVIYSPGYSKRNIRGMSITDGHTIRYLKNDYYIKKAQSWCW